MIRLKTSGVAGLLFFFFALFSTAQARITLGELEGMLGRWEVEEAWKQGLTLLKEKPADAELLELLAYIAFYRGDYPGALAKIREAISRQPGEKMQAFQLFLQQTHDVIGSLATYESAHFIAKLDEKRDGILAPYILDALEKTYRAMGQRFGYQPEEKVRVEVLPDSQSFYYVSSLSQRDIEVAGAVGLAKFNKVMILSPRALVHGYRYLDAVSHEYLHYLIVRLSGNKATIWFHEGLAKHEEARWRGQDALYLHPLHRTLLARAVADGKFVGFDKMEPSLVKLETPEEVQLAYAEAASAIDYILSQVGYPGLVAVMRAMAQGKEAATKEAIEKVLGVSFQEFQQGWKAYIAGKGLKEVEGVVPHSYKVRESARDEEKLDLKEIKSIMARNWVTLGDMLRSKKRWDAAILEYQKALEESPYSLAVITKLAGSLMQLAKDEEALELLIQARGLDPDHATVLANMGYAYLRLKDYEKAKTALAEALEINPFDPGVHRALVGVYQQTGEVSLAKTEEEILRKLISN